MTICPVCKSEDVDVNGLFFHCNNCGELDDSTLSMIKSSKGFVKIKVRR